MTGPAESSEGPDSGDSMQAAAASADRDLVLQHRYGDPAAFETVYREYVDMVYNVALRMSGDREEAADLTQEVFLRVHRHLGRFRGRSTLRTWIYRVAVNCCRSRLGRRSRAWWRSRLPAAVLERRSDPGADPEERAIASDLGRLLAGGVARLPLVFREAIVLRDVEGLSYQEIAAVLGVRVGTVRSRLARGRERLRLLLEESR